VISYYRSIDPILHRFPYIARYWSKMAKFIYYTCSQRPCRIDNFAKMFIGGKTVEDDMLRHFDTIPERDRPIIGADFAGATGAIAPQSKFCGGDALAVTREVAPVNHAG